MNKSEFIARLALKYPQYKPALVEQACRQILSHISQILCHQGRLEVRSFGSFSVRKREARVGRNPRTGDPVLLKEKIAPLFKPGKALRERLLRAKDNKVPLCR